MDKKLRDNFGDLDTDETRFVIVTNLDDSIDDYDLREKFEKFGHVPSIQLPFETAAEFGKCARLEFALAPAARAACSKLGGRPWRGKRIQAYTHDRWKRLLEKKGANQRQAKFETITVPNKVFVGGLGHLNVHQMRRYFQQYGPIDFRLSKVIMDRAGKSRGYGFIVFEHALHAQLVLRQSLHWIEGKQVKVGPVHEKRFIKEKNEAPTNPAQPTPQQQSQPVQTTQPKHKSPSRSRSYSRSSSSGSSRSSSSSPSRKTEESKEKEVVQPILGEPVDEPEPEIDEETYQREVAKQAAKIEETEAKAKTLQQRRAERRARWRKRKAQA